MTIEPPKVCGVGRVADEPRALLVLLDDIPSDDQLRSMSDFLRAWNGTDLAQQNDDMTDEYRRAVSNRPAGWQPKGFA